MTQALYTILSLLGRRQSAHGVKWCMMPRFRFQVVRTHNLHVHSARNDFTCDCPAIAKHHSHFTTCFYQFCVVQLCKAEPTALRNGVCVCVCCLFCSTMPLLHQSIKELTKNWPGISIKYLGKRFTPSAAQRVGYPLRVCRVVGWWKGPFKQSTGSTQTNPRCGDQPCSHFNPHERPQLTNLRPKPWHILGFERETQVLAGWVLTILLERSIRQASCNKSK